MRKATKPRLSKQDSKHPNRYEPDVDCGEFHQKKSAKTRMERTAGEHEQLMNSYLNKIVVLVRKSEVMKNV